MISGTLTYHHVILGILTYLSRDPRDPNLLLTCHWDPRLSPTVPNPWIVLLSFPILFVTLSLASASIGMSHLSSSTNFSKPVVHPIVRSIVCILEIGEAKRRSAQKGSASLRIQSIQVSMSGGMRLKCRSIGAAAVCFTFCAKLELETGLDWPADFTFRLYITTSFHFSPPPPKMNWNWWRKSERMPLEVTRKRSDNGLISYW